MKRKLLSIGKTLLYIFIVVSCMSFIATSVVMVSLSKTQLDCLSLMVKVNNSDPSAIEELREIEKTFVNQNVISSNEDAYPTTGFNIVSTVYSVLQTATSIHFYVIILGLFTALSSYIVNVKGYKGKKFIIGFTLSILIIIILTIAVPSLFLGKALVTNTNSPIETLADASSTFMLESSDLIFYLVAVYVIIAVIYTIGYTINYRVQMKDVNKLNEQLANNNE